MMFYRVYALYWAPRSPGSGRRYVYILAVILLLEFVVNTWLLTRGGRKFYRSQLLCLLFADIVAFA